ncbi:hypothetical protein SEEE2651_04209, partial [Salmonella enterica subsp. enterica serovar Enteritidis str. 76-2651]
LLFPDYIRWINFIQWVLSWEALTPGEHKHYRAIHEAWFLLLCFSVKVAVIFFISYGVPCLKPPEAKIHPDNLTARSIT